MLCEVSDGLGFCGMNIVLIVTRESVIRCVYVKKRWKIYVN